MVTPSSQTETTGPIAGQLVFTDNNEIVTQQMAITTTIILGQFVTFDASGNVVLATSMSSQYDGIGVASYNPNSPISSQTATIVSDSTLGDFIIQVAVGNTYVYSLAGGTIKFQSALGIGTGTGNYPIARVLSTAAWTTAGVVAAANEWSYIVGRYWGHSKEEKTPTSAASSDIIAVRLGL